MKTRRMGCVLACGLGIFLALAGTAQSATPITVINSADSGTGSLRWAVAQAEAAAGFDIINFAIVGGNSITVHSTVVINSQVEIDGSTQSNVTIGANGGSITLLQLGGSSGGSWIHHVALKHAGTGLTISSTGNTITNCAIGMDWASQTITANSTGIYINAADNQIGLTTSERNVISANRDYGIYVNNVSGTKIQGNYIGTHHNGNFSVANDRGINIYGDNARTLIGGDRSLNQGNVISGNTRGIYLGGYGNTVCGNTIGLNPGLTTAVPNSIGMEVVTRGGHIIGLSNSNGYNIIAGNTYDGIILNQVSDSIIQNNYIGYRDTMNIFGNGGNGINMTNVNRVKIGGNRTATDYECNCIFQNYNGIMSSGSNNGNTICGNYIGTNIQGGDLGNDQYGIYLTGDRNIIGGTNSGSDLYGNIIIGNGSTGVTLYEGRINAVLGNRIGINQYDLAVGNSGGVSIRGTNTLLSRGNVIGSSIIAERNVISGNTFQGIALNNTTYANSIRGNYIGVNAAGNAALPNGDNQIYIRGANATIVGGLDNGEGNVICGENDGIYVEGASGTTLCSNIIGRLPNGVVPAVQLENGIRFLGGANNNQAGFYDTGLGNLITNCVNGISVVGATTNYNGLYGNTLTGFATAGIYLNQGNNSNSAPTITFANLDQIWGRSNGNNYIEVFRSSGTSGQRGGTLTFIDAVQANGSGDWSLGISGDVVENEWLCATASSSDNTSMLSYNAQVLDATPSATSTRTYTPTRTPTPTASPALTATPTCTPSPVQSSTPTVTVTPTADLRTPTPTFSRTSSFTITPTATQTPALTDLGGRSLLAYPNPAKGRMTFEFKLKKAGEVNINIYNLKGELAAKLHKNFTTDGQHMLLWDCKDTAPGVYLACLMIQGEIKQSIKVAVLK